MIRLFIKECLLFGSNKPINRLLGIAAWISIIVFLYATGMLVFILLKKPGPDMDPPITQKHGRMKKPKNKKPAKAPVSLKLMTVPEEKRILSKPLQEALIHFLHHHPADRLRKNLRRMMIDYLMHESARESVYIYDTLLDLDGLFEFLDVAVEEGK